MVAEPDRLAGRIRHAGAIFLGRFTPEVIGDYVGGPNHVLPTSRSARFASGLGVFDFMKRTTLLGCDEARLSSTLGPAAACLARARGWRPMRGRRAAAGGRRRGERGAAAGRIVALDLDEDSIVRWSPEVEHERNVAIFDLLEGNSFNGCWTASPGPTASCCRCATPRSSSTSPASDAGERDEIALAVRPLRRVIKDYFMICESYFQAIKGATPSRIEAIDMARRGLHDEGSVLLEGGAGRKRRDGRRYRAPAVYPRLRAARPCLNRCGAARQRPFRLHA